MAASFNHQQQILRLGQFVYTRSKNARSATFPDDERKIVVELLPKVLQEFHLFEIVANIYYGQSFNGSNETRTKKFLFSQ